MTDEFAATVERIRAIPSLKEGTRAADELTSLWPLTDATQMDNDVHYGENLQVRMTRTAAIVLTGGGDITTADAEFVYEGADQIPGRPQPFIDALLQANEAYDTIQAAEIQHLDTYTADALAAATLQASRTIGLDWDDTVEAQLRTILHNAVACAIPSLTGGACDTAYRFSLVVTMLDQVLRIMLEKIVEQNGQYAPHPGGAPDEIVDMMERNSIPLLFLSNRFAELCGIPQLCFQISQLHGIIGSYSTPNGAPRAAEEGVTLAQSLAPLALAEWCKHRDDILRDPVKEKQRAKQEDERKNKEALAAKFAHVTDDPNKPAVEL